MVADPTTTIVVAEWESEELGEPGLDFGGPKNAKKGPTHEG